MTSEENSPKLDKESVIVQVNRHWVRLVKPALGLAAAWIAVLILYNLATFTANDTLTAGMHFLAATTILVVAHHWFFYRFIQWELSWSIVTNQRVVHFRNLPFLRNDLLYVRIDEIHEVEEKEHGLLPNLMDYGSVVINLAAVTETISLNYIPHPATLSNLIEIIRENKDEEIEILQELCKPYAQKYKRHNAGIAH